MRVVRIVVMALVAAVLGAVVGRVVTAMREEARGGEAMTLDAQSLVPAPQEIVPGLVAALRVQDQPWAALHIPPWLAAFAVNFATVALARELGPLLRMFGMGEDTEVEQASARPEVWTVEATPDAERDRERHPGFRPFST